MLALSEDRKGESVWVQLVMPKLENMGAVNVLTSLLVDKIVIV